MATLADIDAYVNDPGAFVTVPVPDYAAMKAVIEAAERLHAARQMRYGQARDEAEERALFATDEAVEALGAL